LLMKAVIIRLMKNNVFRILLPLKCNNLPKGKTIMPGAHINKKNIIIAFIALLF